MTRYYFYGKFADANVSCEELVKMKETIENYLSVMTPFLPNCPSMVQVKEQLIVIDELLNKCSEE